MTRVRVSAKVDYALRGDDRARGAAPEQVKGERLAAAQSIPHKFLENILADLRNGGIVASQRGADGGYRLARPPAEITVADVIRVVEGPIASVRGERPDELTYDGYRRAAAGRLDRAPRPRCAGCSSRRPSPISSSAAARAATGRAPTT